MEINISAQQMDLTLALKNYIQERVSKITKFSERKLSAEVHLNVEKYRNHIHAKITGHGHLLNSEAEDPDSMYKAIDLCVEKLEKQIRRSKKDRHEQKTAKEEMRNKT